MGKRPHRPQIDSIAPPANLSEDDTSRKQEKQDDLQGRRFLAEIAGIEQDIKERKKYARLIYWLVVGWLIAMFLVLILSGATAFELADGVLIALISGTTINVIGLFAIVANYLFPKP